MTKEIIVKYNSFAFVLLIFIYSLTTVFSLVVKQSVLIVALSLLIIGPVIVFDFIYDFRYSNLKAIIFDCILIIILVIEYITYTQYQDAIQNTILSFSTIGTLCLLVGSSRLDLRYCEKNLRVLMYICFFLSVVYLILIRGSFRLSMRFGYALLPSTVAFLYFFLKERKALFLILFMVSTVLIMAWGSRGALLVILLYLFLFLLKKQNWLLLAVMLILLILSWGLLMDLLEEIIYFVADLTGAQKIEALLKMVSGDVEMVDASSGRDVLYHRASSLFLEKPFGCGVGYWSVDPIMNGLYPHNIFLQIATELGIIGLLSFLVVLVMIIVKLFRLDYHSFMFWSILFSITFGRLLVSSSFWERPEFWLLIGEMLFGNVAHFKVTDVN